MIKKKACHIHVAVYSCIMEWCIVVHSWSIDIGIVLKKLEEHGNSGVLKAA